MSHRVDAYGDPLPRFASLRLGTTRWRHLGMNIHGLVFSDDGALVYGVSEGVSAFDVASGRRVWAHRDRSIVPAALLRRADGDRLVVGGASGLITFFDAATGATRSTVTLPLHAVRCIAVSPDGQSLFAGGNEQGGFFLSPDGELRATLPPAPGVNLLHACYSPDGTTLVTTADRSTAWLWSVADAQPIRPLGGVGAITDRALFTRDGGRVLVATGDGSVVGYDVASGAEIVRWQAHTAAVTGLTLSADGTRLFTRSADGTIALWRLDDRARLATFPADAKAHALSPDETTLAFDDGSRVVLVDLATGVERAPADGHVTYVHLVAPSRASDVVITATLRGEVRAWSTNTGALEFALPDVRNAYYLRALPEGDRYAVMPPSDQGTNVLDLDARSVTRRPESLRDTHSKWWGRLATAECFGLRLTLTNARGVAAQVKAEVHHLAITPDDRHAVFLNGMRLTFWNLGKHTSQVITKVRSASTLALSPRGDEVAVRSHDTVYRVGVPDGVVRSAWKMKSASLAYSPDGRFLAVATLVDTVLFDCATGTEVARFDVASVVRDTVCFSRDGTRLVTADCDSTVLVWDVAEATEGVAPASAAKKAPAKKARGGPRHFHGESGHGESVLVDHASPVAQTSPRRCLVGLLQRLAHGAAKLRIGVVREEGDDRESREPTGSRVVRAHRGVAVERCGVLVLPEVTSAQRREVRAVERNPFERSDGCADPAGEVEEHDAQDGLVRGDQFEQEGQRLGQRGSVTITTNGRISRRFRNSERHFASSGVQSTVGA